MKSLIGLMLLSLSLTSVAGTISAKSSWEAINKSFGHVVRTPNIPGQALGGLFNICVDGDNLRTIKPVSYCVEGRQVEVYEGEGAVRYEWVCDKFEESHAAMPRLTTVPECAQWVNEGDNVVCAKFTTKPYLIPLSYVLDVEKFGGEAGLQLAFRKALEIPACK
jgi:hypothetical protein